MRARKVLVTMAVAGMVVGTVSACAGSRVPPAASIQTGAVDCTSGAAREGLGQTPAPAQTGPAVTRPAVIAGRVPDGFVPVSVVECTMAWDATVPSVLERHLSGDLTALVAALARPDAAKPSDGACPAMAEMKPGLFLVDAQGRYVQVAWPLDECDFIQQPSTDALAALHVDSERVVPIPG